MFTTAGQGDHHAYRIQPGDSADEKTLTARKDYVGIDAIAWFINKKSSFFTERMASGTLEITMSGGRENYRIALGTFELDDGARIAPVFVKPVLDDRNYRGGPITFRAMLSSIKKDTALGSMLKSAASASLGIVAGMVETAALTGPTKKLSDAGQDIIDGVRTILNDKEQKPEQVFDFTGLEYNMQPDMVVGPQTFLLLHRGAELEEDKLSVKTRGHLPLPFYYNAMLEDGAWLLLRIKRSSEYTGPREWDEDARKLRLKLKSLVNDVNSGFISREAGLAQLKPSSTGDRTYVDEFFRLRSVITNDGVLTELQAGSIIGQLNTEIVSAKRAIMNADSNIFMSTIEETTNALLQGKRVKGGIGKAFEKQVASVVNARNFSIVKDFDTLHIAKLSGDELFSSMQYMPHTINSNASHI